MLIQIARWILVSNYPWIYMVYSSNLEYLIYSSITKTLFKVYSRCNLCWYKLLGESLYQITHEKHTDGVLYRNHTIVDNKSSLLIQRLRCRIIRRAMIDCWIEDYGTYGNGSVGVLVGTLQCVCVCVCVGPIYV